MTSFFAQDNRLDAGTVFTATAGALAAGVASGARKEAVGAATLDVQGPYTGTDERVYVVEIDSVGTGTEVGEATFRWSRDGGAGFVAAGIPTSSAPAILEDGLRIAFTGGDGADFAPGDRWTFKALVPHGTARLWDRDRSTAMRTADLSDFALVVDFGEAKSADTVILFDHNLSAATVTLEGNDTDTWSAPAVSVPVAFAAERMHATFPSAAQRYWRLRVEGMSAAETYFALGQLFVGPRIEPVTRFRDGFAEIHEIAATASDSASGARRRWVHRLPRRFELEWETFAPGELATLRDQFRADAGGARRPFFFHHGDLGELLLVRWDEGIRFEHRPGAPSDHGTVRVALREVG
ncbi:MAG: hypothetical protein KC466_14070 [Myxococcales bacterium]|nr:hypothetical protein [Myxococcales bacterium]